ncbi:Uncharacterised protein [Mycobacteroides abscessus subsp. abscessus]|nr:Uncharacterised protein [Mycobacteroides abscessus subsp. abscessus]
MSSICLSVRMDVDTVTACASTGILTSLSMANSTSA